MPLSPGIPYATVTGCYVNQDGTPASGVVRFTPSQTLTDVEAGTIVLPRTVGSVLRYGCLNVSLPVTDDLGLQPVNWFYHVVEDFPGGRTFDLQIPTPLPGEELDLSTFVPMELVPLDLQGTIVGPPGPPGPSGPTGPPGTLPVQVGGAQPTDPSILVWYEVL